MKVACLDLPALPLQLVWRDEPALRAQAVVVIDEDRPQGVVLWACERARAAGVLPGQRYAHALGLHGALRARIVPPERIAAAIDELRVALHALSPRVEPAPEPGTFWLDGDGLDRIFSGAPTWGAAIQRAVVGLRLAGAVVVGWSRFATYAIARGARRGVTVLASDAEERAAASAVPLARLEIASTLRDALARLGVTTLGQLVRLPGGGILERFGKDAHRLYQLAAGERWDPIVPVPPPEAPDERVVLDDDIDDSERLVFVLRPALDRLLGRLAARGRALVALHVELVVRHAVGHTELRAECIKPAAPTLDGRALLRLVHLRLAAMPPEAPVNAARVWADDVAATREQLAMFAARPRRDLRAADEALARVRAELGDDAVVRAVLRDGHLPEASFGWERLHHVVPARPEPRLVRPLVRRLHARPQLLPPQARQVRDDGWLLSGLEHGAVVRIVGPYVISGGWWAGGEVHREYHFAELRRGDCLWVYYDRNRRRWLCQGAVE
ncbi:MAG TPA: DNA polymerase Y family protein [Kofleriaceae bacterium]|nr:DNA polymerase Y family protein [Kofleriaceae bacterium]